jgi:transcriptional regulator with XRE-family HTH domain
MAKKIHRFRNLAAKIKSVREALGYSQEELGEELKPKRTRGAIAQWEMEDARRTEPTNEQLFQIAHMTDRPKHYLLWFMNDSVDVNTHIEYNSDGTIYRRYSEQDFDGVLQDGTLQDDEVFVEMKQAWEAEENERQHGPGQGWVSVVLKDPSALDAAYRFYQELYPETATRTRAELTKEVGLIVREFDEKDQKALFIRQGQMFETTVLHFLSFLSPDSVEAREKFLGKGSIRHTADYWDGRSLIEFTFSRAADKRLNINEKLGNLFVMEKMIGRSVKKMLVVCTDHPAPNASPMILEDVNSCRLMGISLLVAHVTNPQKAAEAVAIFLKTPPEEIESVPYYVPPNEAFLTAEAEKRAKSA